MLGLPIAEAVGAGYSPQEITDYPQANPDHAPDTHVTQRNRMDFDIARAVGDGHSPQDIVSYLVAHPDASGDFDVSGALKAGYSPAEIVDHLNPKADAINVQGIPVLAPIDRGIAHLREGAANLATDLGATGVGSFIRQSIPTATLAAQTSGAALSSDLANRHYLSALGDFPSAVLEQAAPVAGAVVAGAASGGSVPAALAAGAGIGAATQGDGVARQRALNNGRNAPDASDLALGLGGGALAGAVGSLGLGGAGSGLASAVRNTALHTAADAAQPEMAALAASVGTDAGAQNASPADMAAAGLTGLGTRGALATPALARAGYEVTPAGRREALADQFNAMAPDQQALTTNTAAASDMLQTAKAGAVPMPSGLPADPALARTVGDLLDRRIGSLADSLDAQGLVTPSGSQDISDAWKAAADPGRVLLRQHLDALDGAGLEPGTAQTLKDALTQRDIISRAGVDPEPSLLGAVGGAVGGAATRAVGHAVRMALPTPVAMAANAVLGPMADAIGARFGLSDPNVTKAGAKAAEMLMAAGQPVPDTFQRLQQAIGQQQSVVEAQQRLMDQQAAADAAAAQKFKVDYGDAQAMNRQFDQNQRAMTNGMYADAGALNRQFDQTQRVLTNGQYADAQAMNRQFDQSQNFQRAQEVGDAQAIDAQRTRGINLLEREGGKVAMMALRRAQAQQVIAPDAPVADPSAPGPAPSDPVQVAMARAAAAALPTAAPKGPDLTAPMPGLDGLSAEAREQGQLLPEWQHGLGKDVLGALNLRGTPKNINIAQEVNQAVQNMSARGWFDQAFAGQLMAHQGRVTRGLYNVIRNEMLGAHGVDMRPLDAQASS